VRRRRVDVFPALALRIEPVVRRRDRDPSSCLTHDRRIRQKVPLFSSSPKSHYVTPRDGVTAVETISSNSASSGCSWLQEQRWKTQRVEQRT
jgi:hypothetical protein